MEKGTSKKHEYRSHHHFAARKNIPQDNANSLFIIFNYNLLF